MDVILVDIYARMNGLVLIPQLRKTRPTSKILAIPGGSREWNDLDTAKYLEAHDTLKKPLNLQELLDAVAAQLRV